MSSAAVPTCGHCKIKITTGGYMEVDNEILCDPCYEKTLPKCRACAKYIQDEYKQAFDWFFHPKCFKCQECYQKLEDTFCKKGELVTCDKCSTITERICMMCIKPVTALKQLVVVTPHKIAFHKDCFKCTDCSKPLNPQSHFIIKGNSLFTPACYEKFVVGNG